jgi:type II secretory pathway component GspD/PulD (secretin)
MKALAKTAFVVMLGTLLAGGLIESAAAQEDISQKMIPSMELNQADVREAVRALFKNVGASYMVAPEVQGMVTVSLKNVSFETALQNILRQVDGTYRVEAGVFEIVRRMETVAPTSGPEMAPSVRTTIIRRIKIRSADPAFIAAMLGAKAGSQSYTIAPEISTIARGSSNSSQGMGRSGSGTGGSGGFGSGSSGSSGIGGSSGGLGGGSSGRTGGF